MPPRPTPSSVTSTRSVREPYGRVDIVADIAAAINLENSDHNIHDADEDV